MINLPYEKVVERIVESTGLPEAEISDRIKKKLDQLSGLISKDGAAHIVANELGIKLFGDVGRLQVKNIVSGMRNVEAVAKVVDVYDVREFTTERGPGKVGSFLVGDETGMIRIVLWNEQADNLQSLKKDMIVKIKGGYVRENQGRREVHMNERGKLVINPEGENVGEVRRASSVNFSRKNIKDLSETDQNVELLGTIVQVYDIRFYEICADCGKRAKRKENSFVCEQHGNVNPSYGYVINIFLDDGTENIRAVFFRDQVEKLMGKSKEELLKYKEMPDAFEDMKNELLGKIIKVKGKAVKNVMFDRLEFMTNDVVVDVNPDEEAEKLDRSIVEA